jgi:hypothetical protein
MRYITKIFTLVAALLMLGQSAQAQHTVGVFGGMASATARFFPKQEMKSVWGLGNFGASWRYYSLPRFVGAVGADLELLQRGFSYGYTYKTVLDEKGNEQREYSYYTRQLNSLMMPLVWQPHFYMVNNHVRVYLEAALTFSYNFGGDYSYSDKDESGKYDWRIERDNRWNYGLAGGGGIALLLGRYEVGFRARYYYGYADLLRNRNKYYNNATDGAENPFSYTPLKSPIDNLTFNITLAYRFNPDGFLEWTYKPTHRRGEKREFKFSNEGDMGNMR